MSNKPSNLIKKAVTSHQAYELYKLPIVDSVKVATQDYCKDVIATVKKILKDKHATPPAKLRALNLFHACMMVGNTNFLQFAQKKILKRLGKFAQHRKHSADENRGSDLFGPASLASEENSRASAEFLKNLLTYIHEWRCNFGKGPDGKHSEYYHTHVFLVKENVKFPTVPKLMSHSDSRQAVAQRPPGNLEESVQHTLALAHELAASGQTDSGHFLQLVKQLGEFHTQLEEEFDRRMSAGDSCNVETLLELNDLVQGFLKANAESVPHERLFQTRKFPGFQDIAAMKFEELKQANLQLTRELRECREECAQHKQTIHELRCEVDQLKNQLSNSSQDPDLFRLEILKLEPQGSGPSSPNPVYQTAPLFQASQVARASFSSMVDMSPPAISPSLFNSPEFPERSPLSQSVVSVHPSNPFDTSSSSSSEEVLPAAPHIDNLSSCRMCNCFDRGVLFDDECLQVGFRLSVTDGLLTVALYVGNKAHESIRLVSTEVIDCTAEGLKVSIDQAISQEAVVTGGQVLRNLQVQLINISSTFPLLKLQVNHPHPRILTLRLPLSVMRFIQPRQLPATEAFEEWNNLASSELHTELQLAGIASMKELCMHLLQGGAFTVYSASEAPGLAQGALLSAGTLMTSSIYVEVAVEPSAKACLRVRSVNTLLRRAVFTLMHEQLSGVLRIFMV